MTSLHPVTRPGLSAADIKMPGYDHGLKPHSSLPHVQPSASRVLHLFVLDRPSWSLPLL